MTWSHPTKTVSIPKPRRGVTIRNQIIRKTTNLPLRVPTKDWSAVVTGAKSQFRVYNESGRNPFAPVIPADTSCPRPCVLFALRRVGEERRHETALGVLIAHRQEPLGAISTADLRIEGFETLSEFKWYWQARHVSRGWRPRDLVSVIEVRPMAGMDSKGFAAELMNDLYGEWL